MLEDTSEIKNSFIQFLRKQVPDKSDKIIATLTSIDEFAIATKALPCSFYNVLSEDTISILKKRVLNHKFFIVKHKNLQKYSALHLTTTILVRI